MVAPDDVNVTSIAVDAKSDAGNTVEEPVFFIAASRRTESAVGCTLKVGEFVPDTDDELIPSATTTTLLGD